MVTITYDYSICWWGVQQKRTRVSSVFCLLPRKQIPFILSHGSFSDEITRHVIYTAVNTALEQQSEVYRIVWHLYTCAPLFYHNHGGVHPRVYVVRVFLRTAFVSCVGDGGGVGVVWVLVPLHRQWAKHGMQHARVMFWYLCFVHALLLHGVTSACVSCCAGNYCNSWITSRPTSYVRVVIGSLSSAPFAWEENSKIRVEVAALLLYY